MKTILAIIVALVMVSHANAQATTGTISLQFTYPLASASQIQTSLGYTSTIPGANGFSVANVAFVPWLKALIAAYLAGIINANQQQVAAQQAVTTGTAINVQ